METELMDAIADFQAQANAMFVGGVVQAVVRTGVADHVGDEARPIADVAADAGLHTLSLRRALRLLETRGWFRLDGDAVAATPKTALLRRDSLLWPSVAHIGSLDAIHRLDHTLRTGESAFEAAFGASFWSYLADHPDEEAMFAESMRNEGAVIHLVAVPALDLGGVHTVADVGGGNGHLLAAVLRANPDVHGILVDQAAVLAKAVPELVDGDLASRATLVTGDLFGAMPAADAYLLARILHDWSDDDAATILRQVRQAAAPGATLYDLDLVIPPGGGSHISKVSDIGMMTLFGEGRERTRHEFDELFARTGWRLDDVAELPMSAVLRATAV